MGTSQSCYGQESSRSLPEETILLMIKEDAKNCAVWVLRDGEEIKEQQGDDEMEHK